MARLKKRIIEIEDKITYRENLLICSISHLVYYRV
jgi:hypothetical protein